MDLKVEKRGKKILFQGLEMEVGRELMIGSGHIMLLRNGDGKFKVGRYNNKKRRINIVTLNKDGDYTINTSGGFTFVEKDINGKKKISGPKEYLEILTLLSISHSKIHFLESGQKAKYFCQNFNKGIGFHLVENEVIYIAVYPHQANIDNFADRVLAFFFGPHLSHKIIPALRDISIAREWVIQKHEIKHKSGAAHYLYIDGQRVSLVAEEHQGFNDIELLVTKHGLGVLPLNRKQREFVVANRSINDAFQYIKKYFKIAKANSQKDQELLFSRQDQESECFASRYKLHEIDAGDLNHLLVVFGSKLQKQLEEIAILRFQSVAEYSPVTDMYSYEAGFCVVYNKSATALFSTEEAVLINSENREFTKSIKVISGKLRGGVYYSFLRHGAEAYACTDTVLLCIKDGEVKNFVLRILNKGGDSVITEFTVMRVGGEIYFLEPNELNSCKNNKYSVLGRKIGDIVYEN